jgi:chorismate synthase
MNSFGRLFRVTIYGESHGPSVGVILDGCPAGLPIEAGDFDSDLQRRNPQLAGTTARKEPDRPQLLSGVFEGKTTGAPLLVLFTNSDAAPDDYQIIKDVPRPGHADLTARVKFGGHQDHRGGGHFSGRLTLGIVAAGVVAKKVLGPVRVEAQVTEAGGSAEIAEAVELARRAGDSIGGIVECECRGAAAGLGEPFFDSVESLLSHVLFAVPAIKGVEFGAGFQAPRMRGTEHNDQILDAAGSTATNHAGGINGGLTNGNPIKLRVAVKPTPSVGLSQRSVDIQTGQPTELLVEGRHDTCIALRMPVIVEAAVAMVMADLMLLAQRAPRVIERT